MNKELKTRQAEIDMVSAPDFINYWKSGLEASPAQISALRRRLPAVGRLEDAFEKVFREARETVVDDIDHPAVWFVYNMGLIVKTPKTLFSIDLHHRRAEEFAPFLDFALITHNHNDHYTEPFKFAMDRKEHKTVINNFFDNYGVADRKFGGYTRAKSKKFRFGDVTIVTGTCDHNAYLKNYTTTFEVRIGNFTLFHSGDCFNHAKLHPSRHPDLWVLHPRCGMNAARACVEAVRPKTAVVAHLQEIGHPIGYARWTYQDGLDEIAKIEVAGFHAIMPLWGDRLA
jgi:L-ascorbate metabolism protein UlaG (beta-lactamase superfamily)